MFLQKKLLKQEVHQDLVRYGDNPITVTAKRLTKTYGSTKISAGKTGSFEFSNIKSDTEFYIVFEGNGYSFSGHVK